MHGASSRSARGARRRAPVPRARRATASADHPLVRESEDKFKRIFESSLDAVTINDVGR